MKIRLYSIPDVTFMKGGVFGRLSTVSGLVAGGSAWDTSLLSSVEVGQRNLNFTKTE
jgi:hypothetical protein